MKRKEALAALDALDAAEFDALADDAIASKHFKTASVAIEVVLFLVIVAVVVYLGLYLGHQSPPVTHRLFLLFVVFVTLPLATLKARELLRGWAMGHALIALASTKGLIR